jgi:4-hydroxy-2-oxoheptanedioate aldolase
MQLPVNVIKRRLAAGETLVGFWAALASPAACEVMGLSGIDWVLIDTEHAPNELNDVVAQLRALKAAGCPAIVRPAWNDMVLVKRLLDAGADSLLLPFVQNEAEARAAVGFTRYPPAGVRGVATAGRNAGFGRVPDYLATAHREIAVLVQIETLEAVNNLEAIAGVEGVDAVFVGPSDLAASMGHLGNPMHPEVQAAIADIAARMRALGKPAAIYGLGDANARAMIALGYRMVCIGSDVSMLVRTGDALVQAFRGEGRDGAAAPSGGRSS